MVSPARFIYTLRRPFARGACDFSAKQKPNLKKERIGKGITVSPATLRRPVARGACDFSAKQKKNLHLEFYKRNVQGGTRTHWKFLVNVMLESSGDDQQQIVVTQVLR